MFVSIIVDLGNEDSQKIVQNLLFRYGFKQIQNNTFESLSINENNLSRLKLDLDRSTDFYDSIRIYQYPIKGTLVITSLTEKRWRRNIIKEKNTGGANA
ncbi:MULTISPECIES: CRISPR-associated protein Cas2 [unclassified Oceanispirochaeta]|uniref:CRISPR-associated protein Cas2 n=1 Tax=unclassified Oceanispirochaeta TaxID=2635722 RepID=UPI000E099AFF|nr:MULTISPECIES: CRISPR-associated protein Cas2 [unclassified Oceanispirochaeta]MBF9015650.1 CRISPR-associated protein Cas2 [Oceanispirochaeta sp. M2]NPD73424.1 CRISPR-associated protein Cas2 [Oceanispirochaeta sp. M1]RDG30897.1 CRISPR-associated protein Cas2 [Oceanispirochaeta sp. M1]